ncbi:hypothetical protein KDL44_13890 [bacterium]|nr:hypothetical protein [bacterium]
MKYPRHTAVLLLAIAALIAGLVSCGGGSTLDAAAELSPVESFIGVSEGDFRAVRYNDRGYRDSSLNSSIDLRSFNEGGRTVVEIDIADESVLSGVALELHFDAARLSPVSASFSGLMEADVELASFNQPGVVALGQVDADNTAMLSGGFARVEFEAGPQRAQSAAGDAHSNPVIFAYGEGSSTLSSPASTFQFGNSAVTDSAPADYMFWGAFAGGDGNQDGESNIGDITPLGILLGRTVGDSDYSGAKADYDYNTSVNISDITPLAVHLGESTAAVEILLGDSDNFDGSETVVATHSWSSATAPSASTGTSTTDWSGVWAHWTGEISLADVQAADTDMDGSVYLAARTSGSGASGPLSVSPTPLTYAAQTVNGVEITDFDVMITDESSTEQTATGGTFNWPANSSYDFEVTGIHGAWDQDGDGSPETAFTPDNLAGLSQTDYDNALAAVISALSWESSLAGDSSFNDFHSTWGSVINFTPNTSGASGVVFPDDDPDSTSFTTPEGSFGIVLAQDGDFVPNAVSKSWNVDVSADAEAGIIQSMTTSSGMWGNGNHVLDSSISTTLQGAFFWGSAGEPANLDNVSLVLYDFNDPAESIVFDYSASEPAGGGEFAIRDPETAGGPYGFTALTQLNVTPDHVYGLHMNVNGTWTSVNKPGEFLEATPAPLPVELETFPKGNDLGDDTTMLYIFSNSANIRRNDHVVFDLVEKTASPVDFAGFSDMLVNGGTEFPIGQEAETNALTPVVRFMQDTAGQDVPFNAPDLGVINLNAANPRTGRIDLDIQALNTGSYGFQVFDRNQNPIGYGDIVINEFIFDSALNGVDWGVNITDDGTRGNLQLSARDFSSKVLNGNNIASATPDVLWFEFSGTHADEAMLRFGAGNHERELNLVASGLGSLGFNVLAIYVPDNTDWQKIGAGPEWTGTLVPGNTFELTLFQGGDSYTWDQPGDLLTVIGGNPND